MKNIFFVILLILSFGAVDSLKGDGTRDVEWTVKADPAEVTQGDRLMLRFTAEIGEGWYLYAMDSPGGKPVEIFVTEQSEGLTPSGTFTQSEPETKYDPNFDMDVRSYESLAEFETIITVAPDAPTGSGFVKGEIEFMFCNDRLCTPSFSEFNIDINVLEKVVALASEEEAAPVVDDPEPTIANTPEVVRDQVEVQELSQIAEAPSLEKVEEQASVDSQGREMVAVESAPEQEATITAAPIVNHKSKGLWAFILLAAGAGLAALLTPCVFPMIPLTISFFSKQGGSRAKAIRLSLLYGLSIIVIFTVLGVLMALLVGAAGAQTIAANPWVNLFIGLVFVIFAFSLLGMFELRLPNSLLNYFNQKGNENSGVAGVLFMGTTLTLVSFSCTAPFVGGLLATAASKEFLWPILGMIAFSFTFALPFVLFAMFPNWLESLPRSGAWMNVVKVTLGFVELAAAFKFLSNADLVWQWGLLSRPLVIAFWIVIFGVAGMYLLGKIKLSDDLSEKLGTGRLLTGMAFLALSFYLIPGLLGAPLNSLDAYLPPRQATDISLAGLGFQAGSESSSVQSELPWSSNHDLAYNDAMDSAFSLASADMKPVFVDFTGYTCTNCRQMESTIFRRQAVAERLTQRFSLLQLYTDHPEDGRDLQKYQLELTGTVALPTYAILSHSGELLHLWAGMASEDEFVGFLDQAFAENSPYIGIGNITGAK